MGSRRTVRGYAVQQSFRVQLKGAGDSLTVKTRASPGGWHPPLSHIDSSSSPVLARWMPQGRSHSGNKTETVARELRTDSKRTGCQQQVRDGQAAFQSFYCRHSTPHAVARPYGVNRWMGHRSIKSLEAAETARNDRLKDALESAGLYLAPRGVSSQGDVVNGIFVRRTAPAAAEPVAGCRRR